MKNTTAFALVAAVAAVAAAAGYGWAARNHDGTAPAASAVAGAAASSPQQRKLLYYRNPRGLPDTSPTPKKDPMGMDYIAVYEGEDGSASSAGAANQVRISVEKVQKLGVRTEAAAMRPLGQRVRAIGRVEPDERRVYAITPKFEGYVERLHVNVTGQPVSQGQALFEVYSPELVAAQREYAIAAQGVRAMAGSAETAASMRQLAESGLQHLRHWDMPRDQIEALARTGQTHRTITFRSPVSGIVTEKKALQGMRFMPGETLYTVTDLGSVWVIADVFERDLAQVRVGSKANVRIDAYPGKGFAGTVTYVYPTLKAETRTVPVRIELRNPGQLLKPAMYAQVELSVGDRGPVLTVPESAVIDSGTRQLVLVQVGDGRFEPREVKLGARSDAYVQVLEGVRDGEPVVVAANFLIDAESNLKAAVGGLGAHGGHGGTPKSTAAPQAGPQAASGHRAEGSIESTDAQAGTVSINHGPVATLKWPAMTMEFKLANTALLKGLTPGATVSFEFIERQPGEWVITAITPAANPHAGH